MMRYRRVRASTNKAAEAACSSAPATAGEGDRPEGVVEGAQDSKVLRGESNDGVRRFIDIAAQLRRWNAHHCHAVFLEPSVTLSCCGRLPMSWLMPSISMARCAFGQ